MNPIDHLKSVLYDPTGKCCITGSDEDRAIVDRALQAMAEQPAPVQQESDDSLLLCASDLEHSAIYDNHSEMQSCIRAVALRIKTLADPQQAQRKPLPQGEWPKHPSPYVNDQYRGYLKSDLDDYAMQVLAAHGIKEQP